MHMAPPDMAAPNMAAAVPMALMPGAMPGMYCQQPGMQMGCYGGMQVMPGAMQMGGMVAMPIDMYGMMAVSQQMHSQQMQGGMPHSGMMQNGIPMHHGQLQQCANMMQGHVHGAPQYGDAPAAAACTFAYPGGPVMAASATNNAGCTGGRM